MIDRRVLISQQLHNNRAKFAMVMAMTWLLVLSTVVAAGGTGLSYRDVLPSLRPVKSRRECHVHKCNLEHSDVNFMDQKCYRNKGHLQPMGAQQRDMKAVPRVEMSDPRAFYQHYIAGAQPVILAGTANESIAHVEWTDEFLMRSCHLDSAANFLGKEGHPWDAIIEANKIIVTNTRYPLLNEDAPDINFCTFLRDYMKAENADRMYLVSPLTDPGVQLGKHVEMPAVLQCPEIHESVHDTRLWMSSGNTSSSLHFDTHENLMLQVFGTKTVVFWPPSQSHKLYMDFHDRFGLSPVNPDRVDTHKFPLFSQLRGGMVAHLHAGDALLIPDGWWHQVRRARFLLSSTIMWSHHQLHHSRVCRAPAERSDFRDVCANLCESGSHVARAQRGSDVGVRTL